MEVACAVHSRRRRPVSGDVADHRDDPGAEAATGAGGDADPARRSPQLLVTRNASADAPPGVRVFGELPEPRTDGDDGGRSETIREDDKRRSETIKDDQRGDVANVTPRLKKEKGNGKEKMELDFSSNVSGTCFQC